MTKQKNDRSVLVPIIVALIGVFGTCITAFFTVPEFRAWVGAIFNPSTQNSLAIEQIPQRVFPYYGEVENVGGFAKIELIFDGVDEKPSYEFKYTIPPNQPGYAGIAFQFEDGLNISSYKTIVLKIQFDEVGNSVDFYIKDIGGRKSSIRIVGKDTNELTMRYELSNFPEVNLNALLEIGLNVQDIFSSGQHTVTIHQISFEK
jgi:hypothetical protein